MEKKTYKAFGKYTVYLLGKDKEGVYYWLKEPTWDHGWCWGVGHIETYTNNKRPDLSYDTNLDQHFNSMFFDDFDNRFFMEGLNPYEEFENFFTETVLDDKESWVLLELMQSIYTLKEAAEIMHCGRSRYTDNPCKKILIDKEYEKKINEVLLPALFEEVKKLLTK